MQVEIIIYDRLTLSFGYLSRLKKFTNFGFLSEINIFAKCYSIPTPSYSQFAEEYSQT